MSNPTKDQDLDKGACDDWTKIPVHCAECGKQYLRKVRHQHYCDEHRHLAGAVIRPQEAVTSNLRNNEQVDKLLTALGLEPGVFRSRMVVYNWLRDGNYTESSDETSEAHEHYQPQIDEQIAENNRLRAAIEAHRRAILDIDGVGSTSDDALWALLKDSPEEPKGNVSNNT